MANPRGINWTIEECRTWVKIYLSNYKNVEESVLFEQIAQEIEKPFNSVKIRFSEIKRILGGEYEFPIVTPNFTQAINEKVESGEFSINKLKMIFD
tara:strand:- start:561 stop:848 length:288 start_codon:yes stop_codon:yes gene_type:complete